MKFWPNGNPFTIKIGDVELTNSKCTKFLGVTLDEDLSWNDHVGNIINKLNSNKMLLVTTKNMYFAHVYPYLTYSLVVWGSMASKSLCNNLYRLQKSCLKLIAKENRNSNVEPLFAKFKIIRFPDLIEGELCKLGYKLDRKLLPSPVADLFLRNNGKKKHKYNT